VVKGQSLVIRLILRLEGAHGLVQTPLWGRRASCLGPQSDRGPHIGSRDHNRVSIDQGVVSSSSSLERPWPTQFLIRLRLIDNR